MSYDIDFFFCGLPRLAFSIGRPVTLRWARFNKHFGQYQTAQSGGHCIPTQTLWFKTKQIYFTTNNCFLFI